MYTDEREIKMFAGWGPSFLKASHIMHTAVFRQIKIIDNILRHSLKQNFGIIHLYIVFT